jgi:hypothetical protein
VILTLPSPSAAGHGGLQGVGEADVQVVSGIPSEVTSRYVRPLLAAPGRLTRSVAARRIALRLESPATAVRSLLLDSTVERLRDDLTADRNSDPLIPRCRAEN